MTVTDSETKFVDKAGLDHAIDELKKLIEDSQSGDVDLSDYVTQEQLQAALDSLDINIDLSAYATKAELQQAIVSIDLSGYATTAYVDNAIANIPSGGGGDVDLSNYYTKAETYNKEEVNNLIPTVTNGQDGQDGITPHIDVTTKHWMIGTTDTGVVAEGQDGQDGTNGTDGINGTDGEDGFSPTAIVTKSGKTATITITDKNGTTTASVSDGQDGTGGGSSGGSGDIYSTEETAIGTWIDGRTIYRKVIDVGKLGAVSSGNFGVIRQDFSDTDMDVIISMKALLCYSTTHIVVEGSFFNINMNPSTNMTTYVSSVVKSQMVFIGNKNNVKFYYGSNFASYNCTMIIEYIKAA